MTETINDTKKGVKRIQSDLPAKSFERLNALKEKTEAGSYGEVIRNALSLYEMIVEEVEDGKEFYTKDASGETTKYRMFA